MISKVYTLEDIEDIAKELAYNFRSKDIVVLIGEIGVGKTTLVSTISKELQTTVEASSPTFAIIAQYPLKKVVRGIRTLVHIDTYRLTHVNELYELGIENISNEDSLTFIEWGERIVDYLEYPHFILIIDEIDEITRKCILDISADFPKDRFNEIIINLKNHGWIDG